MCPPAKLRPPRHWMLSLAIFATCECRLPLALAQDQAAQSAMEQQLLARIEASPEVASNWRLLCRVRLAKRDVVGALQAGQSAVELDPTNAGNHFDFGRALLADDRKDEAAEHFVLAQQIAPPSDYGIEATELLEQIGWPTQSPFTPLGESDAQPNRFAGAPNDALTGSENQPLSLRLEVGALYNSNVQLAPVDRLVSGPGLASAQGFLAPELEWRFASGETWSLGTRFQGYFNLNEAGLAEFNLQEYKPGVFWQRSFFRDESEIISRFQYDFLLDQFAGDTLATRQVWTASISVLRTECETSFYWSLDQSDFVDDGTDPAIDSLDGWTNTIGASRTWYRDRRFFDFVRCGTDLQFSPLEGADFSYRGIFTYLQGEFPAFGKSVLAVQCGGGFRKYPDFTATPSRNEALYRARVELRKAISANCDIVAMATYDRFACPNDQFDTYRFLTGIVTIFHY